MPLDETNYGSYSDYHSAIDQQDATLTPGITPVSYTSVSTFAPSPPPSLGVTRLRRRLSTSLA